LRPYRRGGAPEFPRGPPASPGMSRTSANGHRLRLPEERMFNPCYTEVSVTPVVTGVTDSTRSQRFTLTAQSVSGLGHSTGDSRGHFVLHRGTILRRAAFMTAKQGCITPLATRAVTRNEKIRVQCTVACTLVLVALPKRLAVFSVGSNMAAYICVYTEGVAQWKLVLARRWELLLG
jgi:hypothetical protein